MISKPFLAIFKLGYFADKMLILFFGPKKIDSEKHVAPKKFVDQNFVAKKKFRQFKKNSKKY